MRGGEMKKLEILHLTLEREWFDEIVQGVRNKEYRKYKPYWKTRLEGREYDVVKFRNGYSRNAPEMVVEFRGLTRDGKSRNADYVIKLGRILELKRWPPKD
jgi:hypothetical protein